MRDDMTTKSTIDIRRHNLTVITKVSGNKKDIADLAEVTTNHIYQVACGAKGLSSKACRKIEQGLNLPFGWMDTEQTVDSYIEATVKNSNTMATLDTELLEECITDVISITKPEDLKPALIGKVVTSLYITRSANGKSSDAEALMFSLKA